MAIDPNIALGVRSVEFQNPLAQYGQIAAIQNAQNQNALAQFQLGSARRQEESQNALSDAYQKSFNPQTGQFDPKLLISNVARSKAAYLLPDIQGKLLESETKQATLAETQQKTKAGEFKLAQDKLNYGLKSLGDSPTPQEAIKKLNEGVTKGYFDFSTAASEAQKLQSMTPEQYKEYRIEKLKFHIVHFHKCVGKFTCRNFTVYIQTFVGNFQIITAWDKEEITIPISFTFQQFLLS